MAESNGSTQARIEDFVATHRNDALGDVATRRLHENDRVRIWEMNLAPGEASELHHHQLDYLVVQLEGDRVAGVPPPDSGGSIVYASVEPGRAAFVRRGGREWAFNIGTQRYREILIELKD